jgi:hypothetical protein
VDWLQNAALSMWNFLEGIGPEPIPFIPPEGNTPRDDALHRLCAIPCRTAQARPSLMRCSAGWACEWHHSTRRVPTARDCHDGPHTRC